MAATNLEGLVDRMRDTYGKAQQRAEPTRTGERLLKDLLEAGVPAPHQVTSLPGEVIFLWSDPGNEDGELPVARRLTIRVTDSMVLASADGPKLSMSWSQGLTEPWAGLVTGLAGLCADGWMSND